MIFPLFWLAATLGLGFEFSLQAQPLIIYYLIPSPPFKGSNIKVRPSPIISNNANHEITKHAAAASLAPHNISITDLCILAAIIDTSSTTRTSNKCASAFAKSPIKTYNASPINNWEPRHNRISNFGKCPVEIKIKAATIPKRRIVKTTTGAWGAAGSTVEAESAMG